MATVLFICVGNSCRSQMAEGFLRHLSKGGVAAHSAGTHPAERISGKASEVMAELGIDISDQYPKAIGPELAAQADYVISMGCGVQDSCPAEVWEKARDWGLEDPYGQDIERYRKVRDEIQERVKALLNELGSS